MNNEINEKKEKEINISMLFKVLRKNIILIVAVASILGIVGGAYSALTSDVHYAATAQFLVKNINSTSNHIQETTIAGAIEIATNCANVATTEVLAREMVDQKRLDITLGMDRARAIDYVKNKISSGKPSADDQQFYVTITTTDADLTLLLIEVAQDVMADYVKRLTSRDDNASTAASVEPTEEVLGKEEVYKVDPPIVKTAIVGAAAGFILTYVIFLIIYLKDTKVYDEETIKAKFSYPIIATIPQWISENDTEAHKLSRKKRLARDVSKTGRNYNEKLIDENTPFAIVESFKLLRTNLSYSTTTDKTPVFAVTSDFSGAGKSVVSANLAVAYAQFGKRTLLIEGDMRCPDLANIFEGKLNETGLSELLSANSALGDDTLSDVGIENLTVISSGRVPPNPSELLGSEKMSTLIESCKEKFDVIIIDLPPVYEVTDACVISSSVDAYVIVARSRHSDVDTLATTIDNISRVQGNVAGFVVNDVNIKIGAAPTSSSYGKYGKYAKYRKYSNYIKENKD